MGVAIPCIANEFSINIKIGTKHETYRNKDEISFVLNVLNICFGNATQSEKIFWKAYGERENIDIKLTEENVTNKFNLNSVIELFKNTRGIIITANPIETLTLLRKKDGKWRFFLPLDGPDSVLEGIKMMNLLKQSSGNTFEDFEWVVGSLDFNQYNSAPLLLLIKDSAIQLVLTDFLDVLIMTDGCNEAKLTEIDLKRQFDGLLSLDSLDQTFSQEKANYATKLHNMLSPRSKQAKGVNECPFNKLQADDKLNEALKQTRLMVNNAERDRKNLNDILKNIQLSSSKLQVLENLADKGFLFSVIEELIKLSFNENFHELKHQLEDLESIGEIRKSREIEEKISAFNKSEMDYTCANRRLIYIFGDDLINRVKSKQKSKLIHLCLLITILKLGFEAPLSEIMVDIPKNLLEYLIEHKSGVYKNIVEIMKKENDLNAKNEKDDGRSALHTGKSSLFLFHFIFINSLLLNSCFEWTCLCL